MNIKISNLLIDDQNDINVQYYYYNDLVFIDVNVSIDDIETRITLQYSDSGIMNDIDSELCELIYCDEMDCKQNYQQYMLVLADISILVREKVAYYIDKKSYDFMLAIKKWHLEYPNDDHEIDLISEQGGLVLDYKFNRI